MQKFFNTAGACIPSDNYTVSMKHHFKRLKELIDNKRYFILHAPRQTGKTTLMLQLMEQINQESEYITLYLNIEAAQPLRNNIEKINNLIISEFESNAKIYLDKELQPQEECFQIRSMSTGVSEFLSNWCYKTPHRAVIRIVLPIVFLIS